MSKTAVVEALRDLTNFNKPMRIESALLQDSYIPILRSPWSIDSRNDHSSKIKLPSIARKRYVWSLGANLSLWKNLVC
jgi:hypothetical protein